MKRNLIYPGGIFFKRLLHLFACSFIGVSIFLVDLENRVLNQAEQSSDKAIELAQEKLISINHDIETRLKKVDIFVPGQPVQDVNTKVAEVDRVLQFSRKSMRVFFSLIVALGWIRILYWISLIYPIAWLYFDWRLGDAKKFLVVALTLVIGFNLASGFGLWMSADEIIAWLSGIAT